MQKGDLQSSVGFLQSVGIMSCLPFLKTGAIGKGYCAKQRILKNKTNEPTNPQKPNSDKKTPNQTKMITKTKQKVSGREKGNNLALGKKF